MFFILFSNFWIQAYTKRSKKVKSEDDNEVQFKDEDDTVYSKSLHKRTVANGKRKYN